MLFKKIKLLIDNASYHDEYHWKECDCGGRYRKVEYLRTVGDIDNCNADDFCQVFITQCNKCGVYKVRRFTIET